MKANHEYVTTTELRVKTVKYFKSIEQMQHEVEEAQRKVHGQIGGD